MKKLRKYVESGQFERDIEKWDTRIVKYAPLFLAAAAVFFTPIIAGIFCR